MTTLDWRFQTSRYFIDILAVLIYILCKRLYENLFTLRGLMKYIICFRLLFFDSGIAQPGKVGSQLRLDLQGIEYDTVSKCYCTEIDRHALGW